MSVWDPAFIFANDLIPAFSLPPDAVFCFQILRRFMCRFTKSDSAPPLDDLVLPLVARSSTHCPGHDKPACVPPANDWWGRLLSCVMCPSLITYPIRSHTPVSCFPVMDQMVFLRCFCTPDPFFRGIIITNVSSRTVFSAPNLFQTPTNL